LQTAINKPIFGTGPGTFAIAYQAVKKPESEMARLTHNDYLQQASDSGFPGLITYMAFIGGMLWVGYRRLVGEINGRLRHLAAIDGLGGAGGV
jgi:O-antigen ligase